MSINQKPDMVNHPPHYTQGAVECIDAIEAALGREGFLSYLQGQIIRYTWRTGLKNAHIQGATEEDMRKANWYSNRLIATLEKHKSKP